MKFLKAVALILALILFNSLPSTGHVYSFKKTDTSKTTVNFSKDKREIQALIRKVLLWSQSKNSIDLLPAKENNKKTRYIGFDLQKLKKNLGILKATNYFSSEFIDNYGQIILILDKKIKNKEFEKWPVGELPPFNFANDVNPWCDCQDVPYDKPNPWSLVNTKVISLSTEKGELLWNWVILAQRYLQTGKPSGINLM